MIAIIHLLENENLDRDLENLAHNRLLYHINCNHFLLTNIKNPKKLLYNNFEQILYSKSDHFSTVHFLLKMIKNIKYTKCIVLNSNKKYSKNEKFFEIEELLCKFSVINNVLNF